jgi:hypothetical protein
MSVTSPLSGLSGRDADVLECLPITDAVEKGLRTSPNSDSGDSEDHGGGGADDESAERRSAKLYLSVPAR